MLVLSCFLLAGGSLAAGDDQNCPPAGELAFACGMTNAEDLTWLGNTGLIVASGLASGGAPGHLYLFNPSDKSVDVLFPDQAANVRQDKETYPDCPGPVDTGTFSAHGISVKSREDGRYLLYVVAHGERESVEVFEVDASAAPVLTWVGCVEFPRGDSINSVVALDDPGFLVTRLAQFGDEGLAETVAGGETGFLYRWSVEEGLQRVAGTEMSGPNGIEISPDGRHVYVASWGLRSIVVFRLRGDGGMERVSDIPLGFRPDNLRISAQGNIVTAGHHLETESCPTAFCVKRWEVAEVEPLSGTVHRLMQSEPLQGFMAPTVALPHGEGYWLGTFHGNRIAYLGRKD